MNEMSFEWLDLPWLVDHQHNGDPPGRVRFDPAGIGHILSHAQRREEPWGEWFGIDLAEQIRRLRPGAAESLSTIEDFALRLEEELRRCLCKPLVMYVYRKAPGRGIRSTDRVLVLYPGIKVVLRQLPDGCFRLTTAMIPRRIGRTAPENRWSELMFQLIETYAQENEQKLLCLPRDSHAIRRSSEKEGKVVESRPQFVTPSQWGFDEEGIWREPNLDWPGTEAPREPLVPLLPVIELT